MNHVLCPICNAQTKHYCSKTGFDNTWIIHKCNHCGHGFVVNRPSLAFLTKIYSVADSHHPLKEDTATFESHENFRDAQSLVKQICKLSTQRGYSLDVGSGNGAFSFKLSQTGYSPVSIDLDPHAEKQIMRVPNATFIQTSFEDFSWNYPFATIVMSQVLEHAIDPVSWLKKAGQMLNQEGILAVALPNFAGVYRILGHRDPFLCPPIHLNFFTPKSLRIAFEAAGLKMMALNSKNNVCVKHPTREFSLSRRIVGRTWNSLSWMLNPTTFGIILQGYAKRVS
jgi:2-polyprenyl-3-methyl-5-hydroxy-6-metoxy-1,4-benzoquinol methylase